MTVAFRVDASWALGSGHVMRCLTLADELQRDGGSCHFIGRDVPGHMLEYVRARGHASHALLHADVTDDWDPDLDARATAAVADDIGADWLVVDHYRIDARWERALRPRCRRLLVIDDLADRSHDCDLLLDQNVYVDPSRRYDGLVPAHCERLIGPEFALLRREFVQARRELAPRPIAPPRRMHVFFGGSDPTGDTLRTLRCLPAPAVRDVAIDVVIGMQNADRERIVLEAARLPNAQVAVQVRDMARRVADADVAIGACGSAALERCSLGLATLTLVTADNQRELAAGMDERGAIVLLGRTSSVSDDALAAAVDSCLRDPERLHAVSAAGVALFPDDIDGARRLGARMRLH